MLNRLILVSSFLAAGACLAQTAKPLNPNEKLRTAAGAAPTAFISFESTRPGLAEDDLIVHRGFFISADGLAVIPMQAFDGGPFNSQRESDREPVEILGVVAAHPDSGLAVVRTNHQPVSFLPLAAEDSQVGDQVGIPRAELHGGVVVAPVLAIRQAPVARSQKSAKVLSIGANLGDQGAVYVPAGTPIFNDRGQVTGCLTAPALTDRQRFLLAFPVSTIASRLPQNPSSAPAVPFPLPTSMRPADPLALDATYQLGRRAQLTGQHLEAERLLRKALARREDSAAAWQRLGFVLRDLAQDEEAMQCFERAIKHGNNLGTFILNRADQFLLKGRLAEAAEFLQAACKEAPLDHNLHRACGLALLLKKDADDAEPYLRTATKLAPDSIACWELLSKCLATQGKWDEEKVASDKIYELESIYRPQ